MAIAIIPGLFVSCGMDFDNEAVLFLGAEAAAGKGVPRFFLVK